MRGKQTFAATVAGSATALVIAVSLTACGGGSSAPTTAPSSATAPPPAAATTPTAPALQGEALQTAAGDIPDNQVFVTYRGTVFSMKTPEGWARTGTAGNVTFRDKNNIVRVVVGPGAAPTVASVRREVAGLRHAQLQSSPLSLRIGASEAVKAVYRTTSPPNPVTGKSVTLIVDRYELERAGRRAVVDLGSPVGVDNVDAYRLMIQSFRLR
jgi:hypothetical protein